MTTTTSPRSLALLFLFGLWTWTGLWAGSAQGAEDPPPVNAEVRQRCVGVLRHVLAQEKGETRVCAAEFLLTLDYRDGVVEAFAAELPKADTQPGARIGVWRVMAQAATDDKHRAVWIAKIREVFLDTTAPDRVAAIEALAELGYQVRPAGDAQFAHEALQDQGPLAVYARWVLANSGKEDDLDRLADLLTSADPGTQAKAAGAIRQMKGLSPHAQTRLAEITEATSGSGLAGVCLRCAQCVHAPQADRLRHLTEVARFAQSTSAEESRVAGQTLAQVGRSEQAPLLIRLLDSERAEIRAVAAYALLRISRRVPYHMSWLDWGVIAGYFVSMLAIGWYYSRRTTTTDDYLLAGRSVRSLSAGLSLFASLFSTLSYLAMPGEMIKYGPLMVTGAIASFPLVGLIVGWLLIPFIMKLKVTTAYELLESHLGLGVRMLASVMFLLLRLLWMAALIYATVGVVLVPLLNLDRSYIPYLSIFLGLITVIYTAMGGLRAVMLTNVIKAVILFGMAVLALVVITVRLGGVGAWWPTQWPSHWPEPVWGYDPSVRMSFLGIGVAMLVWFVCTSGSDQMAIQRYLSTRDVRAARRALVSLLVADALVMVFLSAVGLALSAYFWANPHLVPDGQTILSDADKLFGRFMAVGFPSGLCGLAISGLLIAAMSSLSSGINSACSVVTVDFINRFGHGRQSELGRVRSAKYVSVGIGAVVVTLACFVGLVQGNLIELCYKVVNSLTAPLFGLFFMAMFVRRATGVGTLVGAAAGLAVVIVISFWQELTGTPPPISFVVAMPASLVVQVAVGVLASLIFRRKKRAPL